ncbi:DNA-deoxyinosine glycosylase [Sphingomonas sinipercae]|uniref:DNA-deoxyinosine glycosylase n=1 Tax=Sphingomonas sinipercae TaxID=2714944 RepID=A0A6G7ZM17_9SPHN|nr:DNA-deoxyinosine glycosylase [Sphingomonas sinipercae]
MGSGVASSELTKQGLPPVARADARLFILGSLPGDASLSARQYYAHPRNQFWRLAGSVIDEPLSELAYAQRLERLTEHRIALWDVIQSAVRPGSLDLAIRNAGHNPLADYFAGFPELRAVAFNGGTAAALGRRLLAEAKLDLIDLPSSSPANTRAFDQKRAAWLSLRQYL